MSQKRSGLYQDATGLSGQAIAMGPTQTLAVTATAATMGSVISTKEQALVRLASTVDCWVSIGTSPTAAKPSGTASDTSMFFPAGVETVKVDGGEKISVIRDTSDGILSITEAP